jgi:UTP--glucose-1-phosphate uridylyltransferase
VVFSGRRYDTGDKLDFIRATLRIAIDRPDIGPELRSWLKDFAKEL